MAYTFCPLRFYHPITSDNFSTTCIISCFLPSSGSASCICLWLYYPFLPQLRASDLYLDWSAPGQTFRYGCEPPLGESRPISLQHCICDYWMACPGAHARSEEPANITNHHGSEWRYHDDNDFKVED